MGFLTSPLFAVYRRHNLVAELVFLSPAEEIITYLKVAMIVGFILSAPYGLTQIWGFVAAGLYAHERRWVRRFAPTSIVLFFLGVFFLLLLVNPLLLDFLLSYRKEVPRYNMTWMLGEPEFMPWVNLKEREIRMQIGEKVCILSHIQEVGNQNAIKPMIRLADYILFILELSVAFGISFQVPVVVAFIVTLRIASAKQIGSLRRYIWFVMCIVAAVITPTTDLASMFLLLGPMVALLEIGLLAGRAIERARGETVKT
jgi:sec-independent protein translocase protein TatC